MTFRQAQCGRRCSSNGSSSCGRCSNRSIHLAWSLPTRSTGGGSPLATAARTTGHPGRTAGARRHRRLNCARSRCCTSRRQTGFSRTQVSDRQHCSLQADVGVLDEVEGIITTATRSRLALILLPHVHKVRARAVRDQDADRPKLTRRPHQRSMSIAPLKNMSFGRRRCLAIERAPQRWTCPVAIERIVVVPRAGELTEHDGEISPVVAREGHSRR